MNRRKLTITIGLAIVIILLFIFLVDLQEVARQLRQANKGYLLAASIPLAVGLIAYAGRWWIVLAQKPTWRAVFHAGNIGHMVNCFIPLRAGEAARILAIGQSKAVSITEATSSVVVERLLEQLMRLLTIGLAIALGAGLEIESVLIGLLFLLVSLALLIWFVNRRETVLTYWPPVLARLPRLTEKQAHHILQGLQDGLAVVAAPRQLAAALSWSLLTWLSFGLFHYLIFIALDLNLPASQALVISLAALALAPPSAPTQPGIYHASIVAPLVILGFNRDALTAYAIILHAIQLVWMSALGIWGLSQTGLSFRELLPTP